MYIKNFEIRWNDVDLNRHVGNNAFIQYGTNCRVDMMFLMGLTPEIMAKHKLAPVVFSEQLFYFKEIMFGDKIQVQTFIKGASEDGMFFQFEHNIYNGKGQNCVRTLVLGAWIDIETRKLTGLPKEVTQDISKYYSPDFKVLTKEDTRAHGQQPKEMIK